MMKKALHIALVVASLGTANWVAAAPVPKLTALRDLEPGEWELRGRGEDATTRKLCVTDLRQLLQLQQNTAQCRNFIVADSKAGATMTYDCAAAGSGRTEIRVETPRLVQVSSQGMADGAPFAFEAEGRRTGSCQPSH